MIETLDWKSVGSILATLMFFRSAIRNFLPPEIYEALKRISSRIFFSIYPEISIRIDELESNYSNELYESVQYYLNSKCLSTTRNLKLSKPINSKQLSYTMMANQETSDTFNGIKVKWSFYTHERTNRQDMGFYILSFHPKYKETVHSSYIPYVMRQGASLKYKNRDRRLYTNRSIDQSGRLWSSVPFTHPSTFDTVAINPALKKEIKDDLLKFVSQREFYTRVGRAWKRGYLLYGPPGTGKTSLIAAITNFLDFDIYDLELTEVTSNSQLRKLLIATSSKSVIIVEDVDCSLDLSERKKVVDEKGEKKKMKMNKLSLSGVLNFVDGLWSSCGGERLMIFTTNHKDNLDAALLRPGRMDKHINLSYCEFPAFKILMKNYLYTDEHKLIEEVEKTLPLVKITPADIAEVFMSCNHDSNLGMRNLVEVLKTRLEKEDLGMSNVEEESKNLPKSSQKKTTRIKKNKQNPECDGGDETTEIF